MSVIPDGKKKKLFSAMVVKQSLESYFRSRVGNFFSPFFSSANVAHNYKYYVSIRRTNT